MTSTFVAPTNSKQADKPAVVDIRDEWKFAFTGHAIKTALLERVDRLESEITSLGQQLAREVGNDANTFAALLVAMASSDPSTKARYVRDLTQRTVELQEKRDQLARAAKGFSVDVIYVLGEDDMKEIGL